MARRLHELEGGVELFDFTNMETHMKQRANATITTGFENGVLKWLVKDAGELSLDLGAVSEQVRLRAAIKGLTNRVIDAAALGFNEELGRYATPEEKFAAMKRLVDWYGTGTEEWNLRTGGQAKESAGGLLVQVLCEVWPEKEPGKIKEWVKGLGQAKREALLQEEKYRTVAERIRAELATKVDTGGLEDELESL